MKRAISLFCLVFAAPMFVAAANKETIELQRDVAQVQEQTRALQRTFDEKFSALQVLVQQTLDTVNRSSSTLGGLQGDTEKNRKSLEEKVVSPVVSVGAKVDAMSSDVSALRESVADLTSRMNKIQGQLTDINNVLKAVQMPVAAPPPAAGVPQAGLSTPGAPPVKAATLYENAVRDKSSGKTELAMGEFQDYVKFYNTTDLAPNAQFYIADILYSQGQFDSAIQEFDKVLEAYPNNNKTADAHFMKGKTLFQLGKRNAASKEFLAVVNDFPGSAVAAQARAQLRALGVNPPTAATARRKR